MYKLLLCLRYLRTRFIALASIISVMLGVATMIVVNSVMSGFGAEMRDRLHNMLADVVISTTSMNGVADAERYMAIIEQIAGDKIEAMSPTVEVYGMLTFKIGSNHITRPITLVGIDPASKFRVSPLEDSLESFRNNQRAGKGPWDLTDEAAAFREDWVRREAWIHNDSRLDLSIIDADPTAASGERPEFASDAAPVFSEGDETPIVGPAEAPGPDSEPDASVAREPRDLFQDFEQRSVPSDPAAPLAGRAYVGVGLISYQQTNPKTGETETHYLVRPGDDIQISTISNQVPPQPVSMAVTVVDTLKTGMSEYDSNLVLCNLEFLQENRNMIDPITGVRDFTTIQLKLRNFADAPELVRQLKAAFPPNTFIVETWEDKQGPLLAAVEMESAILNVLLFLIIAVAGFGILAIFFMIVVEKTRDIGILKALGASSNGIMSIFLSYGLALGIVGSGVGVALGLLFVRYINQIEEFLSWVTGRDVFDDQIYYFSEIPTLVSGWMVFWVAFGAIAIAVLASILPARRAARLHPVQSLRYE